MWITGAGHANWFFVLARTEYYLLITLDTHNDSKNAKASKAFTGFIVDGDSAGLSLGKKEDNMGQR